MTLQPLLEVKNVKKTFGNVQAIKQASFLLHKGEIHALLGANGAGKSTFIKILSGAHQPTEGSIRLNDQNIHIRSPREAKQQGIFTVYQEVDTALVPSLTVADNIVLDSFAITKKWFVRKKQLDAQAAKALSQLHVNISLSQLVSELTLAEKQMVLIARALLQQANILILDEPTAPLSVEETKHLFSVVRKLKQQGVSCIFITHRLPEVFEICDTLTVMRDGQTIQTAATKEMTQQSVVKAMLGHKSIISKKQRQKSFGEIILNVQHISDGNRVKDASFSVSKGEIVGIVGLVGAGKTELASTLFGATKVTRGSITLNGKKQTFSSPYKAIKAGIAFIPEERRKEGLFIHQSVAENISFPYLNTFSHFGLLNRKKESLHADTIIQTLSIKTDDSQSIVEQLSGGNQQKVVIGKWLTGDANIYLFDEPTKGVDIGAKSEIFDVIDELASKGKGIIYLSSEISEVLAVSDRILVLYDGRIIKEFFKAEATEENILLFASGGEETTDERQHSELSI